MVLLCPWRHRASSVAIDVGRLKWEPLNAAQGANGLIRWLVLLPDGSPVFAMVETAIGQVDPFFRPVLEKLAAEII